MDVNYIDLLKKSYMVFKSNLILFLPVLISLGLFAALAVLLFIQVIIFVLLFQWNIMEDPSLILNSFPGMVFIVMCCLIDIILIFAISSYIRSMLLCMYMDIVKKGKTQVDNIFGSGKTYFKIYFEFILFSLCLFSTPLLVAAGIVYLCYAISNILAIVFGILFLLVYLAYFFLIGLGLFFMEPIIASKKGSIIELAKLSFSYSYHNLSHMLLTWLVVMAVSMCVSIALGIISFPLSILQTFAENFSQVLLIPVLMLSILFQLISSIVNIVTGFILNLFIFNSYFSKRN